MVVFFAGTGFQIPQAAANALNLAPAAGLTSQIPSGPQMETQQVAPPIATQCFMLSNMFEPNT